MLLSKHSLFEPNHSVCHSNAFFPMPATHTPLSGVIARSPLLAGFIENLPHACLVTVAEAGQVLYHNHAFRQISNADNAQSRNGTSSGESAFQHICDAFLAGSTHGGQQQWETEIQLADGRVVRRKTSKMPIDGLETDVCIHTFEDITSQKQRETELQQAKLQLETDLNAKQNYLATLTHELRTPLNAVIAMSHLLMADQPQTHQTENLETLQSSAETLLALINNVLDFGKIEANKVVFEETVFHWEELLRNAVRASQYRAEEKGVRMELRRNPSIPPHLVGDPARLMQVLNNLIGNAIKFTEKGVVMIETECVRQTGNRIDVRFVISDTGIGIPEAKLHSIFDDYTQAGDDTTRKFGGTGLGLSITKRLLELQGGHIEVKSCLGIGSSFSFMLPFKTGEKPVARPARSSRNHSEWQHKRVLLVEDNEVNIIVASKFLKYWQLQLDVARNGCEAVEKVQANSYDLVLMDLQMPEMDGFQATRCIRALKAEHFKELPIIALTANVTGDVRDQCLRNGMTDFMTKPFTPDALHGCLAKYLSHHPQTPATIGDAMTGDQPEYPASTLPDHAAYIWNKISAVSAGDVNTQQHLFRLSVEGLRQFRNDYQTSLLQKDADGLRQALHKSKTLLHMLTLESISQETEHALQLISQPSVPEASLEESIRKVHGFCDYALG